MVSVLGLPWVMGVSLAVHEAVPEATVAVQSTPPLSEPAGLEVKVTSPVGDVLPAPPTTAE